MLLAGDGGDTATRAKRSAEAHRPHGTHYLAARRLLPLRPSPSLLAVLLSTQALQAASQAGQTRPMAAPLMLPLLALSVASKFQSPRVTHTSNLLRICCRMSSAARSTWAGAARLFPGQRPRSSRAPAPTAPHSCGHGGAQRLARHSTLSLALKHSHATTSQ